MAPDLPTGTVTLLFTDVEASTRLLEEVGDARYGELLAEHHRVLRDVWASHHGVDVDTAGDAFFVAFARPSDALAAAGAAQERLAGGPLRVRIGVHTGEVSVNETGYLGLEVHRAARIAASGHGGQVLVSASTAAVARDARLSDLGEHRFKDLAAPERVFQLGEGDFPPLKSLYRSNLPVPATAFLGRARELDEVVELLRRGGVRLVTLTGPGGTGKTRLALQAAAEASDGFPDGVHWVPLAALRDPDLVVASIAQAVDVTDEPGRELVESLVSRLAGGRTLLLLDNAEHLLPELAGVVASLLSESATPSVLVTSRERLQVTAELVYPVPELAAEEGVALFLTRAAAAGSALEDSEAVRLLCARLDHLPLALELAAARASLLSPQQLLERLGQRLDLLKGGRDTDPRQQTLRATIEWSHDLLGDEEQRLLAHLSVFAGGCTVEAAERVCDAGLDTLQSLLDKSLLRRRDTNLEPRFWMLETVRQFADEQLERGGARERVEEAFAEWALSVAERADPHLRGPDQLVWMAMLDEELDNLRAGLGFLLERSDADRPLRLLNALSWHMARRGRLSELQRAYERALASSSTDARLRCRGLLWFGPNFSADRGVELIREALSLARSVGDARLEGLALEMLAGALGIAPDLPSDEDPLELLDAAGRLFDRAGADDDGARLAINRAAALLGLGRLDDALEVAGDAVARTRRQGNRHGIAVALANRADALTQLGRTQEAGDVLLEAVALFREIGDTGLHSGYCLAVAAEIATARDDPRSAAVLVGAWDAIVERTAAPLDHADAAVRSIILADVTRRMDEEGARAARASGYAMDAEAAATLAEEVARSAGLG